MIYLIADRHTGDSDLTLYYSGPGPNWTTLPEQALWFDTLDTANAYVTSLGRADLVIQEEEEEVKDGH